MASSVFDTISDIPYKIITPLIQFLPKNQTEINEEQLFLGQVGRELYQRGGENLHSKFERSVSEIKATAEKNKRRMQLEEVGTQALNHLVQQKQITQKIADEVRRKSWTASQLDGNPALWDSISGKDDPTRAVAPIAEAIQTVDRRIKGIENGSIKLVDPSAVPLNASQSSSKTNSTTPPSKIHFRKAGVSGNSDFLWKPVANSSGTATVLIPASLGKSAEKVEIMSANGISIDIGKFTSFGDDGLRAKYVFSKEGKAYPSGSAVVVTLQGGKKVTFPITGCGGPARKEIRIG